MSEAEGEIWGKVVSSVQPFSAIIGALISALVAVAIAYFWVSKRKVIKFWIGKSEDITRPLKKEHQAIVFKVNERELSNLNRSTIVVKNVGNTAIVNFHFEIMIHGDRHNCFAEALSGETGVGDAAVVKWNQPPATKVKAFGVDSPFLNRGETLRLVVFFDGPADECSIACRMEDVAVRIKRGEYQPLWRAMIPPDASVWTATLVAVLSLVIAVTTLWLSLQTAELKRAQQLQEQLKSLEQQMRPPGR